MFLHFILSDKIFLESNISILLVSKESGFVNKYIFHRRCIPNSKDLNVRNYLLYNREFQQSAMI